MSASRVARISGEIGEADDHDHQRGPWSEHEVEYREEVDNRELTREESESLDRYNNVPHPNYDGMAEH